MRRLHFSLKGFAGQLREYHAEPRMRSHAQEIVESLLADGLFDAPITSPSTWGIPVPVPGFDDQRLEVWAEVGPGYLASTMEAAVNGRDWRTYWDEKAKVVQFFGIDNTVPHTLLYPALYFAHGRIRPPDHFVINRFHRLDGEKFSTSRQHAVWAGEALAHLPVDALRYYLALTASEDSEENFTVAEFRETVNRDLFETIGPFLDEAVRAAASSRPPSLADGERLLEDLRRDARALGRRLEAETFSLREAVRTWRRMASTVAVALDGATDGATHPQRCTQDGARDLVRALSLLASCAYPIMPGFAYRLWAAIGAGTELRTHGWGKPIAQPARRVDPPPVGSWFPEVANEQVALLSRPRVGV
jgi:methionyl-tRNA synthetase